MSPDHHPALLGVTPDLTEMAHSSRPVQGAFGSLAIVLLSALVVAFGFIVWAVFVRKPARRRERGTLGEPAPATPAPATESHRRRRRRREHRNRNATLAETGGLPPVRPDDPPSTQS